jgi:hypothetical protein
MCRISLVLAFVITLACIGCGRSKTYTGVNGEKVTVDQSGDKADITFTNKDGEKVRISAGSKGTPLPKDFPKDVPIYSGAQVNLSTNAKEGMMVVLKTGDSSEKVKEFYDKSLKEQGWESEESFNMGQNSTTNYKKDNRKLIVQIISGEETTIQLIISQEKENK